MIGATVIDVLRLVSSPSALSMFSISYLSQSCSTYLTEDMSLQTGKLVNVTQSSHDITFNNAIQVVELVMDGQWAWPGWR